MATFSVNQNRQLFVAKKIVSSLPANLGDLKVGGDSAKTYLYFQHMGHGGLNRSDIIDLKKVTSAKITKASDMERKLKQYTVTLDSTVNGGLPISGQDYILRVFFRQYIGESDTYQEARYGAVHAYKNMTASDFYKTLAISLVGNLSKEIVPLVNVYLKTAGANVEVTPKTAKDSLRGTYTGVVIVEAEQPWRLGVKKQEEVFFDVIPTQVIFNSEEVIWGIATKSESTTVIKNGKKMADLEYFCMGERGDQYRTMGWPNNLETKYLVDPEKAYHSLDIHYFFNDGGIGVQHSEKDITILFDASLNVDALISALADKGITVENPNT